MSNWTKNQPTEPGWYWVKSIDGSEKAPFRFLLSNKTWYCSPTHSDSTKVPWSILIVTCVRYDKQIPEPK